MVDVPYYVTMHVHVIIVFNHSCCLGFEKEMYCTKMVSKKVVAMVSVAN